MTYREKYIRAQTWQDKCVIVNLYHCLQVAVQEKWNMRLTARYFSLSLGSVSEAITLAQNIDALRDIPQRKDALAFVRIK